MLLAKNSSFSKKPSQSDSNITPHIAITDTRGGESSALLRSVYYGDKIPSASDNPIKHVFFYKEICLAKQFITLKLWNQKLEQLIDEQAVCKKYDAIILLHDMTKNSGHLKHLIKGLRDTYKQEHIILAGTNNEDIKNHLISPQDLQELAQKYNCSCFFINLQKQAQIDSLLERICKIILRIDIKEEISEGFSDDLEKEIYIQKKGCFCF